MCIKTFKEELAWIIDKQLQVISNKMLAPGFYILEYQFVTQGDDQATYV